MQVYISNSAVMYTRALCVCVYNNGMCRVATIGYHIIYKIVDTCIVKICNNLSSRGQSSNESK